MIDEDVVPPLEVRSESHWQNAKNDPILAERLSALFWAPCFDRFGGDCTCDFHSSCWSGPPVICGRGSLPLAPLAGSARTRPWTR